MKDLWMKNLLIFFQFFMKWSDLRLALAFVISILNLQAVFDTIFPPLALTEQRSVLISYQDMVVLVSKYSQDKVL